MDGLIFNKIHSKDYPLLGYFSWIGGNYPFIHPSAPDIVIGSNTTWDSSTDPEIAAGYKRVRKLTIASGVTLKINKSPFYLFADEIFFANTTSVIDASGFSGASSGTFPSDVFAKGGNLNDLTTGGSGRAQAGCGGGMLFVICNRITGAAGVIKANGGNGWTNNGSYYPTESRPGMGALSNNSYGFNSAGESLNIAIGVGGADAPNTAYRYSTLRLLADGAGGTSLGGKGGGSGFSNGSYSVGGGSGIGGGAGVDSGNAPIASLKPNPKQLLDLAQIGCLGGGGGGAIINNSNTCSAGGGGGGSVVVYTRSVENNPTLQANGGTGAGNYSGNGSAGVTYLMLI